MARWYEPDYTEYDDLSAEMWKVKQKIRALSEVVTEKVRQKLEEKGVSVVSFRVRDELEKQFEELDEARERRKVSELLGGDKRAYVKKRRRKHEKDVEEGGGEIWRIRF